MGWLTTEARGKQLLWVMLAGVFVNIFVQFFIGVIFVSTNVDFPPVGNQTLEILTLSFPLIITATVVIEEGVFRLPLSLLVNFGLSIRWVLFAALVLSTTFGLIHGSVSHIAAQGVGGFAWCLVYLKCGGCQGKWLKPFGVTATCHLLYDAVLFLVLILLGVRYF